jgi:sugar phosphate isomerase/epimerase
MTAPIAVQLYSLRDVLPKDFAGVIHQVAAMGYAGVETAGFAGTTAQAAAKIFAAEGLQVCSAHSGLPLGDQKNEVLDTMAALGCKHLIQAYIPPEEFTSVASIQRHCDALNEANIVAQANGITLYYHNHWWEYEYVVEGRPAYQIMLDHLQPGVLLELDTYWVQVGGRNAADVVKELGARAPLLHIKDGVATKEASMLAVGDGVMDWAAVIGAASAAQWLVVELDRCDTDMLTAVGKSVTYLTSKGYGHGR